jgi:hypothetical protein
MYSLDGQSSGEEFLHNGTSHIALIRKREFQNEMDNGRTRRESNESSRKSAILPLLPAAQRAPPPSS